MFKRVRTPTVGSSWTLSFYFERSGGCTPVHGRTLTPVGFSAPPLRGSDTPTTGTRRPVSSPETHLDSVCVRRSSAEVVSAALLSETAEEKSNQVNDVKQKSSVLRFAHRTWVWVLRRLVRVLLNYNPRLQTRFTVGTVFPPTGSKSRP